MVVVFGKCWGYAEVSVGTGAKLGETMRKWARGMELLLPGAGCPGLMAGCLGCRMSGVPDVRAVRAGCPGSGSVDEFEEHRMERSNPGQNSEDFVDGNWGKDGEKLDLPATQEIRGSNPTKLHHTNKSQKNLGAIF